MTDYTSQCTWPSLAEPFASALRQAVEFIFRELDPVGIVGTGTIIRGTAHARSDLDVYVVHLASHRRRIQRFFSGVPTEIFINPPAAVRAYFAEEDRDGRRLTAHMLATGIVIFTADAVVDTLRAEAAQWLAKETRISDFERISTRYTIVSRLEDAFATETAEARRRRKRRVLSTTQPARSRGRPLSSGSSACRRCRARRPRRPCRRRQ